MGEGQERKDGDAAEKSPTCTHYEEKCTMMTRVYNKDGWTICVLQGWMVPMCTTD